MECYTSSSSKLSNYLSLTNCNVLIAKNKGRNLRTEYTLEAVEYKNTLYYVNFNKINKMYEKYILLGEAKEAKIYREHLVEDTVKTDFYIENHGCIEIKALLSNTNIIVFPDNSSSRLEQQLLKYIEILKRGMQVTFCFIAMADSITSFELNPQKEKITSYFLQAISLGMKIKACSVIYEVEDFRVIKNTDLENSILKAMSS